MRMHELPTETVAVPEALGEPDTVAMPDTTVLPDRASTREWLRDRIDGRVAVALGVAWLVFPQIAVVLEPPANHSEPLIGVLLAVAMYSLLLTMVCGLVARRRWGVVASLAAAGLATAAEIACPASGHHQFGTWWFGGMACMVALVGASIAALVRVPSSIDQEAAAGPR